MAHHLPAADDLEDAVSDGLVTVDGADSMQDGRVRLTDSGRALLAASFERAS